jgi:hypothetical protein
MKSNYLERVVALGERGMFKYEVQEVIKGVFDEDTDLTDGSRGWRRQ